MVKIKQQLIKDTPYKYGRDNGRKFLSLHETGNTNKGADAQAHADLQSKGNSREAAWHYTIDDKQAIQSFTHDFQLWHAGDGRHDGNLNSIAIEICVNSDGNYQKAVQNAQELARHIMSEENIPVSHVVQHHHWSGKDCPRHMRSGKHGVTWAEFIDGLRDQHKTRNKGKHTKVKGLNETSIVDFLKRNGIDSNFHHREKLAHEHGIEHYNGTAQQNIALLNILKKL